MSKRAANTVFVLRGYEFYSGQDLIDECVWGIISAEAAEPPPLSQAEMVHVGQRYFIRYCSACHGAEGRGDGPTASAL
jgi:mono/diheme cytochrome c family protein